MNECEKLIGSEVGNNPSVLRQGTFDLDETLVVSQRDYIFEKMCLVASQFHLTREPRFCAALAVGAARFGHLWAMRAG